MDKTFKRCPRGHYYQGDECPYCKDNTPIIKKAIRMMIDKEKTPYQVREYLVNDCYFTYESADSLIADISNWQEQYDADSKSANNDIVIGLLWVIGGSLVTAITFVSANGGGRYVITYGAIVFGLLQFIAGVILKLRLIHSKNKLINEFNNNR